MILKANSKSTAVCDTVTHVMLPYDIFTRIIDQLASQGDYADLRSCSQTCRILIHPCRFPLFFSVVIRDNALRFAELLKRNPTIANYIRELTYHTRDLSEDIANAFLLLNNIETLVLHAHDAYGDVYKWPLLTPHLQRALIHLFNSPSITCLHIDLFEDLPAILLSSCSKLKYLKMTHCDSFSSEACDTIIGVPPKLLSLHVANLRDYNAMEGLFAISRPDGLPILDLSGLRSLVIDIKVMKDEIALGHILGLIDGLETLKCRGIYVTMHSESQNYYSQCLNIVLQHTISDNLAEKLTISLPTLRALELQWIPPVGTQFDCLPLANLLEALACQPNCINELSFIICLNCYDYTLTDEGWAPLDHILGDRPGFRQLVKLRFTLWSLYPRKTNQKYIRVRFKDIKTTKLSQLLPLANDHDEFILSVDELE